MRLLHTADWHLGRSFEGQSIETDHATVLDQVFQAIVTHAPDVLIIAGDIFDRASPPETAVRQFNDFILRVSSETQAAIVLIAGNHDSGDRIGAMAMLSDRRRSLVRGPLSAEEHPLILEDRYGPIAISGLPFAHEYAARECFGVADIKTPADVVQAQVEAARRNVPPGARWVIVAHAFVAGGDPSESERPLSRLVGGIETVPAEVFRGAHYVALGHLHRPQMVGAAHVRYSGSPLAFGFDDGDTEKSMVLVDLDGDGAIKSEFIPFRPLRRARVLCGRFAELLADGKESASEDFIKIVLTDPERLIDPIKRIRTVYPNTCQLVYERDAPVFAPKADRAHTAPTDPSLVVAEFLDMMRGEEPTDAEAAIIKRKLAEVSSERESAT